jgi:S-adenosylmethionine hydrolase
VLIYSNGYTFIGPNNGVFTFILEKNTQAWKLENLSYILPNPRMTFHVRDIFAPRAAYSAQGIQGPEFGSPIFEITKIRSPLLNSGVPGRISGEVLHPDRFGKILTSLGTFNLLSRGRFEFKPWLGDGESIQIKLENAYLQLPSQGKINWASTFAVIPVKRCAFIVGSSGLLEIASNGQSALDIIQLEPGDTVDLVYSTI